MANHQCKKGQVLKCGIIRSGCRSYIGVKGGFDVPEYLGSQATFTLGQFGGHAGRNLLIGDMLPITEYSAQSTTALAQAQIPSFTQNWEIAVMYGPHGAPDFSLNKILIPSLPMSSKFTITQAAQAFV